MNINVRHFFHPLVSSEERQQVNMGAVTIATALADSSEDSLPKGLVAYGAAYCSPKEIKFDRRLGAKLATERVIACAKDYETLCDVRPRWLTSEQIIQDVIISILHHRHYPAWALPILLDALMDPFLCNLENSLIKDTAKYWRKKYGLVRKSKG